MRGWDLVALVFAAYRITRIVTDDTISLPFRDRLFDWAWRAEDDSVVARAPWRTWAYTLFTCSWCFGWWVSYAVLALWVWGVQDGMGVLRYLILGAVVAGGQGFLASRSDA